MSYPSRHLPRGTATFVLCFILLFLLLIHSDVCFSEMKRGLSICAGVLVPTLFPYMVISEMLVRADLGDYLGKLLEKPMRGIFGVSGSGAGALALGIICGFPIGAKAAASLYERGELSKSECERLLSFCNYPSAPFVIFAVGKNLLANTSLGIFLYAVSVTSGLIFGARKAGAVIFNAVKVEDIVIHNGVVCGVVINWNPVARLDMHVDPIVVTTRALIDGTGHPSEIIAKAVNKAGVKIDSPPGGILGEKPMWMEDGERTTVENTKRLFPGLYASGMAANNVQGGFRMGPIFGGMFKSGRKIAKIILEDLKA